MMSPRRRNLFEDPGRVGPPLFLRGRLPDCLDVTNLAHGLLSTGSVTSPGACRLGFGGRVLLRFGIPLPMLSMGAVRAMARVHDGVGQDNEAEEPIAEGHVGGDPEDCDSRNDSQGEPEGGPNFPWKARKTDWMG